jgi:hypothetical protein
MSVPKLAFFIAKYFGSGVIIATAFIHVSDPIVTYLCSGFSHHTLAFNDSILILRSFSLQQHKRYSHHVWMGQ